MGKAVGSLDFVTLFFPFFYFFDRIIFFQLGKSKQHGCPVIKDLCVGSLLVELSKGGWTQMLLSGHKMPHIGRARLSSCMGSSVLLLQNLCRWSWRKMWRSVEVISVGFLPPMQRRT